MDFAGAELYIPRTWRIVNNLDCILGGVEEKSARPDAVEKTLILRGKTELFRDYHYLYLKKGPKRKTLLMEILFFYITWVACGLPAVRQCYEGNDSLL